MPRPCHIFAFLFVLIILNPVPQTEAWTLQDHFRSQKDYGNFTVDVSGAQVEIVNTPEAFEGYNLFVLLKTDKVTRDRDFVMLIIGGNGEVILEEVLPENKWIGDCPAEFLDPTSILVRYSNTTALYNLTDGSATLLPFEGHHEFEYNPINDTFFTFHYDTEKIGEENYLYDLLLEFDREGNIVWSFNVSTLMSLDQECPYQDYQWGHRDISHANTIYYDVEDDSIYLMLRNANTFWKIDHSTGEVIWGLGEYGNFTLYNRWKQSTNNLFYHAHAVERIDENNFILFDNDFHNQTNEWSRQSRILEIELNESTMTANTSWVWTADSEYSSYLWGDADKLPNGNRLGVFGIVVRPDPYYGGRIVEVNEEHDIVWELSFVNDESYWYGIYRNERFQMQPYLRLVDSGNEYPQGDVSLEWQTGFNYRPKRDMHGTFELYLDEVLVDEGEVIFDRYWRPTTLSYTFQNLSPDSYNATLVVWDGYGNSAISSKMIHVTSEGNSAFFVFILSIIGIIALIVLWKWHGFRR
ncbi:MAG: aryl-sulfate sulfotransferase [Candidatus Thorarchaeota archaeon]